MTPDDFMRTAETIAQRNVTDHVAKIISTFDPDVGHLKVIYHVLGKPTDDDWEECELTCAELIAAFPEIQTAETDCVSLSGLEDHSVLEGVVFSRE